VVFEEAVDAAAAGAAAEALAQFVQVFCGAGGHDFDVAVFGVADPAAEVEFAGFAVNEPAEAYALYATLNEKMENHSDDFSLSEGGLGVQLRARYTGATHGFCSR
jgi:hypothetical protein